jgi:hypothetical protein
MFDRIQLNIWSFQLKIKKRSTWIWVYLTNPNEKSPW